jgi:hypothetical protein
MVETKDILFFIYSQRLRQMYYLMICRIEQPILLKKYSVRRHFRACMGVVL